MSFQVILVIHVLLALGMVGLILIQHGKGAGAGAGFGSGAAGTVFGARGANTFLYKLTAAMALGFLSLVLVLLILRQVKATSLTQVKALWCSLWLTRRLKLSQAIYLAIKQADVVELVDTQP